MDPMVLRLAGPVLVVLIVFAARRWGPLLSDVPRVYLPVVAAFLGAGLQLLAREVGWADADVDAVRTAIEGAIGTGLAGAGVWSLTAPMRKANHQNKTEDTTP